MHSLTVLNRHWLVVDGKDPPRTASVSASCLPTCANSDTGMKEDNAIRLKSGSRFPDRLPWVAKYAPRRGRQCPPANADFYGYLLQRQMLKEGNPVRGKLPLILLHLRQPLLS